MLAFIGKNKGTRYRVIFDHLDRFTRNFYDHADLRREIAKLGAILETPAGVLDERSSSRLMENVTVAFADYHRVNNREQTLNRMQARISNGFAVFAAPSGYVYGRVSGFNGRMLVRVEPQASIIAEAFERYASRQLESQADVVRFLEEHPLYPKPRNGKLPHQRVGDMLRNPIYAGYVEAPIWGVTRRKGHHEPLNLLRHVPADAGPAQRPAHHLPDRSQPGFPVARLRAVRRLRRTANSLLVDQRQCAEEASPLLPVPEEGLRQLRQGDSA